MLGRIGLGWFCFQQSPPPYETQNVFLPSAIKSDINEKGEVENRDFSEKPNENKTKRKFSWTPSIQPAKYGMAAIRDTRILFLYILKKH